MRLYCPSVILILLLSAVPALRAHFSFSYSGAETLGLVQKALGGTVGVDISFLDFSPKPRHDYLHLMPFVAGHTWQYRGTISNSRVSVPVELKVEMLSAAASGTQGADLEYTVRHTLVLGSYKAVTTITGIVDASGDRVLSARTTANGTDADPVLLERRFADRGLLSVQRWLEETTDFEMGHRSSYARVSETRAGAATEERASEMRMSVGSMMPIDTQLGTFETLPLRQTFGLGAVPSITPVLNSDGLVVGRSALIVKPPEVGVLSRFARGIGPVQIAWSQSEPGLESIYGDLRLVATNFPVAAQPLRQPQIVAAPEPLAIEPGMSFWLAPDLRGITPFLGSRSALLTTPTIDRDGLTYRWRTPRGDRWSVNATLYIPNATAADAGDYELEITSATGTLQTAAVRVTVTASSVRSRLVNVASRATTGSGGDTIIAGIVLQPSATNTSSVTRRLLFRAVGPTLRDFGLAQAEPDPVLVVFDSSREIARCDNWDSSRAVADRVSAAVAALGTFPLAAGSRDAALVLELPAGAYTAHLLQAGASTPAAGLVEVYDASHQDTAAPRITNLSTRARIGAGDQILIPGIVVSEGNARLLVRALGPALTEFGVPDALPDPEITLYAGGTAVAVNNDWNSGAAATPLNGAAGPSASRRPTASEAGQQAGASALGNTSRDAAMVVTVPPGAYTLHVRSRDPRQSGVVVAEVFLLNR